MVFTLVSESGEEVGLYQISYAIMTPLDISGGVQVIVMSVLDGEACIGPTAPGTADIHKR